MNPDKPAMEVREILEQLVETAYQDMRGVLGRRKDYRLRHEELATRTAKALDAAYAKEFLGLIGNDEHKMKDANFGLSQQEDFRNQLRAELRKAITNRFGGKSE